MPCPSIPLEHRPRNRRNRAALVAGVPLLLSLALAGCTSQPDPPAVATAADAAPAASATADQVDWVAYDTYMHGYVKCLNDRGLDAVRYLGHDRPQDQELSGMPAEDGNAINPVVSQCAELVPPVERPVSDPPDKPTEEELSKGRVIAACMRKNGFPEYPDPDPNPAEADSAKDGDLAARLKTDPKFTPTQRRCVKESGPQTTGPVG